MADKPSVDLQNDLKKRAGGICECTRAMCEFHKGRCLEELGESWWGVYREDPEGPYTMTNCQAMCLRCNRIGVSVGVM